MDDILILALLPPISTRQRKLFIQSLTRAHKRIKILMATIRILKARQKISTGVDPSKFFWRQNNLDTVKILIKI